MKAEAVEFSVLYAPLQAVGQRAFPNHPTFPGVPKAEGEPEPS